MPSRRARFASTANATFKSETAASSRNFVDRRSVRLRPPGAAPKPAPGLNPVLSIDGQPHMMLAQFISTVPAKSLSKPLLSLEARSDEVMRTLDLLLIGF